MDDMTTSNRLKKLRKMGLLPRLRLLPNPGLFGYGMKAILIDMPSKSPKDNAIKQLMLIQGMVVILNFYGDSLGIILFYHGDDALRKALEGISRITHAERLTQIQMLFPKPETERLSETDWAIIRSMKGDVSKSPQAVSRETGFTRRTVRNRLEKLQREKALMITGNTNIAAVEGMIPSILHYNYTSREVKSSVDKAMLVHFEKNYLWARLTDPQVGYLVILAPSMRFVQDSLSWARGQSGVGSARIEVVVDVIDLWDRAAELFMHLAQIS